MPRAPSASKPRSGGRVTVGTPASPSAIRRAQSGGKISSAKDDNVVREQQSKGDVRPDGPGDSTAPVPRERTTKSPTKAVGAVRKAAPVRASTRTAARPRTRK